MGVIPTALSKWLPSGYLSKHLHLCQMSLAVGLDSSVNKQPVYNTAKTDNYLHIRSALILVTVGDVFVVETTSRLQLCADICC